MNWCRISSIHRISQADCHYDTHSPSRLTDSKAQDKEDKCWAPSELLNMPSNMSMMNNMISASLWARAQETPKNGANTFFTKARKAHGLLMSPASNEHGFPQISLEIPPVNPSGSSTSRSTRSPWTLDDVLGAASGQPGSICLYLDVPERSPESIYIYNYIYMYVYSETQKDR